MSFCVKYLLAWEKRFRSQNASVQKHVQNCFLVFHIMPVNPRPEVIKLFSCSTQLSMLFFLLINVKMPTFVGILTFMSRKNSILGLSDPEKHWISWYFHIHEQLNFYAQLSLAWKKFYNLVPSETVRWNMEKYEQRYLGKAIVKLIRLMLAF